MLSATVQRLAAVGSSIGEDELEQLRRRVLNLAVAAIAVIAPLWVLAYALLGLWEAALIPLLWTLATAALFVVRSRHADFHAFRTVELAMMLVLPFALQWVLGGFAAGSAVALWALTAPLGALFFAGVEEARKWFLAFLALLVVSAVIEGSLTPADVPEWVRVGFFAINLAAVSTTVFLLVAYFVRAREAEHARSEALLLNVLPASVARRLKDSEGVIADAHPEASVLFADITGFTPLADRLGPERLVALLDRVFTSWDALAQRHGLEKIKTVGDEYMAVAGIPEHCADHAERAAAMALEMPGELARCCDADSGPLSARIGIDSGPVVAGVIGRSKFIYDLWGDTVNTASRMESTGEPGRVQVTSRTANRLRGEHELVPRGEIEVKGKGTLSTYFLG